jgi:hypothetical protein
MTVSEQEIARRRKRIAEIRARSDEMFRTIEEEHHQRIADAIHASIREAGESVSVDEARRMLDAFFETGRVPTKGSPENKRADDTP